MPVANPRAKTHISHKPSQFDTTPPQMKSNDCSGARNDVEGGEASSTAGWESEPDNLAPVQPTKDEKLVRGGRITVMTVLLVSAAAVATLAYVLLSKSEYTNFDAQVSYHVIVMRGHQPLE
jgi:hypothetical protein